MEPAKSLVDIFGGVSATAKAAATTTTTVQRWRYPHAKGGTGGYIPRKYHDRLATYAQSIGIKLTPGAFLDIAALPNSLTENVSFNKTQGTTTKPRSIFGCLKGTVTFAPDFDPTAPAFDESEWNDALLTSSAQQK